LYSISLIRHINIIHNVKWDRGAKRYVTHKRSVRLGMITCCNEYIYIYICVCVCVCLRVYLLIIILLHIMLHIPRGIEWGVKRSL